MAWTTPDEAGFYAALSGAESAALKTASLGSGQTDALADILAQAVSELRGYVSGCPSNRLDADTGKVPSEALPALYALCRYRMFTRLPMGATDEREQEYRDALRLFRDIAACKFGIEQPDAADASEEAFTGRASPPSLAVRNSEGTYTRAV